MVAGDIQPLPKIRTRMFSLTYSDVRFDVPVVLDLKFNIYIVVPCRGQVAPVPLFGDSRN